MWTSAHLGSLTSASSWAFNGPVFSRKLGAEAVDAGKVQARPTSTLIRVSVYVFLSRIAKRKNRKEVSFHQPGPLSSSFLLTNLRRKNAVALEWTSRHRSRERNPVPYGRFFFILLLLLFVYELPRKTRSSKTSAAAKWFYERTVFLFFFKEWQTLDKLFNNIL